MCNCGHGLSYIENFRVIEQPPNIIFKIQFFTQKFPNIKEKISWYAFAYSKKFFFGPP